MAEQYSVLMAVYYKENPEYLYESMHSIYRQTIPTDDFVLVADGPLTDSLDEVIQVMEDLFHERLHIVRLPENMGLGRALNCGMKYCKNDLIARMDSDDISRPDRCEKQLDVFAQSSELAIVSGTVEEFYPDTEHVYARRVLPEKHEDILRFAQRRNPFNHPCVMYRKSSVESAGGYQDFYLLEDYYLWIRMLQNGEMAYNIPQPLLWMRGGNEMYLRRSGKKYARSQQNLFKYMRETGFISRSKCRIQCSVRWIASMMPNGLRIWAYGKMLRR